MTVRTSAPCVALLGLLSIVFSVPAALAQTPPVQTCQLGDLTLESGEVIRNFRMTYIAFGTLNAAKSNAILSLHRWTQSPDPRAMVTQEIRDLLARVTDGRPGIGGQRFPRSWTRTDFCPG